MSYKDIEAERAYRRMYDLNRYHSRRSEAISKLGSKCSKCGSTERLELDHIDRKTKSFDIAKMWGVSKARFQDELAKCQLLCQSCHKNKTKYENGVPDTEICGTISRYRHRKCRCIACKEVWKEYHKKFCSVGVSV